MSDADQPAAPEEQAAEPAVPEAPPAPSSDGVAPEIDPLEIDIELLLQEREEYLELSRRVQADFENYKKRVLKQQTEHLERAAAALVEKLLPVLDGFDLAIAHGTAAPGGAANSAEGLEPLYRQLLGVLENEGLERLDPMGKPFDPTEHDAVAHEEGDVDQPTVVEVMRAGYRWKGRVLRPAMVKVRG